MLRHRLLPLLALPAVTLAACGSNGGTSDKDKLTKIITDGGSKPVTICDHLDARLLTQIGGKDGCVKASKAEKAKATTIDSMKITGDTALAKVHDAKGASTINFVRQGGEWKVTASK